ncbi:MAG: lipoyl(octanoyl) transferase LipB [Candidatus Sumerlaeia bacterium]|nr:lipoyl(octanoyl) transferase LipB [Candidatus Sumerlaeia bacterium]
MSLTKALVTDLGRMDYADAHHLQLELQEKQIRGELGPVVLFVEHPPTITVGRRGSRDDVVAPEVVLKARGVTVAETDRGGQVTYHGPGQIVCYPLLQLEKIGLHVYMRHLEDTVMGTLDHWGIKGYRVDGRTGVWVGKEKICAMGVRVRRWWTLHGLALNVTTDLNHFGLIIPCGIRDRGVCSMEKLLGKEVPGWEEVRAQLLTHLGRLFELDPAWVEKEELTRKAKAEA